MIVNSSEHENAERRLRDASSQLLRTDAVRPKSPATVPLSGEKTSILHPRCEAPRTIPRRWRPSGYICGTQRNLEGATMTRTSIQPRSVTGAQHTSYQHRWNNGCDERRISEAVTTNQVRQLPSLWTAQLFQGLGREILIFSTTDLTRVTAIQSSKLASKRVLPPPSRSSRATPHVLSPSRSSAVLLPLSLPVERLFYKLQTHDINLRPAAHHASCRASFSVLDSCTFRGVIASIRMLFCELILRGDRTYETPPIAVS